MYMLVHNSIYTISNDGLGVGSEESTGFLSLLLQPVSTLLSVGFLPPHLYNKEYRGNPLSRFPGFSTRVFVEEESVLFLVSNDQQEEQEAYCFCFWTVTRAKGVDLEGFFEVRFVKVHVTNNTSNVLKFSSCRGVHRVLDEKRHWFKVELQGAQRNREAEVFQVSNDDTAVAQRRLKDKQPEEKKNTDCLVKEHEKEYLTGWKIKTGIQQQNGLVNETNVTLFAKLSVSVEGVEFKVEPHKDHTFKVEPHGNFDHVAGLHEVQTQDLIYYHLEHDREQHSTHELFNYREDNNETAFVFAEAEKIYAHESLTFNNTVTCDVISMWKVRLKDDTDARSDAEILATRGLLDKGKGNVLGMDIVKDQSGNTLRVSQSRFYNGKLEYQMVCTRLDIASEDVGMLDKFDRGLQTDVQVIVDFDYGMRRSITVMGRSITRVSFIESGFELNIVAGIATDALSKAIPGLRFQHRLNLLSNGIG
ncbi:hypothetical protein Tco_0765811 [Tanacetum coccineum]